MSGTANTKGRGRNPIGLKQSIQRDPGPLQRTNFPAVLLFSLVDLEAVLAPRLVSRIHIWATFIVSIIALSLAKMAWDKCRCRQLQANGTQNVSPNCSSSTLPYTDGSPINIECLSVETITTTSLSWAHGNAVCLWPDYTILNVRTMYAHPTADNMNNGHPGIHRITTREVLYSSPVKKWCSGPRKNVDGAVIIISLKVCLGILC